MTRTHRVAVVAYEHVVPFDLSVPCEVFGRTQLADGRPAYVVKVCGVRRRVEANGFSLLSHHGLEALRWADTIVLPGVSDVDVPVDPRLVRAVRKAAERGARVVSICSGAFVLAATGLLDGRRATTHWVGAAELQRRHPELEVDASVLYVEAGRCFTSAGAAAGLDLCLHLVRLDHGATVAAHAARLSVVPLERAGGQAQFIVDRPEAPDGSDLQPLLRWLETHLAEPVTLPQLARRAAMSVRTLNRRFREQTGTTPLQWLLHARVRRAQQLLETTRLSIETVATRAGFGSAISLRQHFRRAVRTSPQAYRRSFRAR